MSWDLDAPSKTVQVRLRTRKDAAGTWVVRRDGSTRTAGTPIHWQRGRAGAGVVADVRLAIGAHLVCVATAFGSWVAVRQIEATANSQVIDL